jgi:pilus assembly protein Flp/PilA
LKFQGLKNDEEGQDLVEYALPVALIALVCSSGVSNVATAVNGVFSNINSLLASILGRNFRRITRPAPQLFCEDDAGSDLCRVFAFSPWRERSIQLLF